MEDEFYDLHNRGRTLSAGNIKIFVVVFKTRMVIDHSNLNLNIDRQYLRSLKKL